MSTPPILLCVVSHRRVTGDRRCADTNYSGQVNGEGITLETCEPSH
jgi:hypothetical protein